MSFWNETVGAALDAASGPVSFHFFAVDRGRDPDGTRRLVDLFAECAVPLDLALVPQALDDGLAAWLRPRFGTLLGLHQHGWRHANHEGAEQAAEFGLRRAYLAQRHDIDLGRRRLRFVLGRQMDTIFTPPWGRSTRQTRRVLRELGLRGALLDPAAIDWAAHGPAGGAGARAVSAALLARFGCEAPIAVALRPEAFGHEDVLALRPLLDLLRAHLLADCVLLRALVAGGCAILPRPLEDGARRGQQEEHRVGAA